MPELLTREQVEAMRLADFNYVKATNTHQVMDSWHRAAATIEALAADLRLALKGLDLLSTSHNHPTADNIRARWQGSGFLEER